MGLSEPRVVFGIHSFAATRRSDGTAYGMIRVLKDSSLSLQGELIGLNGGSNPYEWAVESGKITAEMALKFAEYPNFAYELFLGKAVTVNAAEASGNCSTLTNKKGTSAQHATTGIATATVDSGQEADLKFAKYIVKVITSTTVNVYGTSDVDYTRGTDLAFQDDDLKLLAANLTIVASTAVAVPGTGVELTGGSGTIGMTVGDTALFETRPINAGSIEVIVGASTDVTPEFGALIVAQKRGDGSMFEIEAFKCRSVGLPIGFAEKSFSEADAKAKLLYDSAKGGVFRQRAIQF